MFTVKNSEGLVIIFIASPGITKNLVPAPLVPNQYNIMYVSVARALIPNDNTPYHTMDLGVLTEFKGKLYSHPIYSVVDNQHASERGRMISGSPTKIGRIILEKKDKNIKASVEREGKTLFQVSMVLGEPGNPLDSPAVVFLKTVPSAQKDGSPELKQLISARGENVKVHELIDGEATMEFDQSLTDNFPRISVQQVYWAVYQKSDATAISTGILHDYLKDK